MSPSFDETALEALADTLLDARAKRLASATSEEELEQTVAFAEFSLGEITCALPLDRMRGAMPLRLVVPVPLAKPHVVGVLRFEGHIITANSLATLLNRGSWRRDPTVLLVVENDAGELAAFDCEQVPRTIEVPARLLATSQSADGSGVSREVLLAHGKTLLLLDVDALLRLANEEARDAH